ncbi:Uncharacterised protein [Actinobacillus equuli]|nr:Uncharacterised protein [Actinobacillus equuli]
MLRIIVVKCSNPGAILTTLPKPTAAAVLIIAPTAPLAPLPIAGINLSRLFQFKTTANVIPAINAKTIFLGSLLLVQSLQEQSSKHQLH